MRSSLHLVLVVPTLSHTGGGVAEVVRILAGGLAVLPGLKVTIVCFRQPDDAVDAHAMDGVRIVECVRWWPFRFSPSPTMLGRILAERPDIVHVHGLWMYHCLAVYLWALVSGKNYVVSPHGMLERWIRNRSPWLKELISFLFQDAFLRRASLVQCLTEKEISDVTAAVNGANCIAVPNCVKEQSSVKLVKRPAWWSEEYEGKDIFLYLGRIHEKKGCNELLNAWERLCQEDATFLARSILVVCGWVDGLEGFERRLEAIARGQGNVVFAGGQYDEAKNLTLAAATYFILPSRSEGLPLAILEAWSFGVPTLMTDACNLPEGFVAGAALRISETSEESIMSVLSQAGKLSSTERADMAQAGRKLVTDRFSVAAVCETMKDIYGKVA